MVDSLGLVSPFWGCLFTTALTFGAGAALLIGFSVTDYG